MMKKILMAAGIAALSTSAFAMEPMMMKDGQAMVIKPNGESMMFDADMAKMDMAAKDATAVEEGIVFFMMDGKLMMTKDAKMPDGMMTSDAMMKAADMKSGDMKVAKNMVQTDGIKVDGKMVTVPAVMSENGGYVALHTMKDGKPMVPASIGHAMIKKGENKDVMIETDYPLKAGENYLAMLHDETNGNDTYDFGEGSTDVDTPTMVDGKPVVKPFDAPM